MNRSKSKNNEWWFLELLERVVSIVFPNITYKWYQDKEYTDEYIDITVRVCANPMSDYTRDHYIEVLNSFLCLFKEHRFTPKEKPFVEKFLVALLEDCILWHSDIRQDKVGSTYQLFFQNTIFRNIIIKHFRFCPTIIVVLLLKCIDDIREDAFHKLIDLYRSNPISERNYASIIQRLWLCSGEVHLFKTKSKYEFYYEKYQSMLTQLLSVFPDLRIEHMSFICSLKELEKDFDELKDFIPLLDQVQSQCWDFDKLPQKLEFDFRYPNGVRGDVVKNLVLDYGSLIQIDPLTWRASFTKEQIPLIDMLLPDFLYLDLYESDEAKQVIDAYLPYGLRQAITKRNTVLTYNFDIYQSLVDRLESINLDLLQKRNKYYSQLVLDAKISPKWISEAQLFVLVSSKYPDAIYQYHTNWLRAQSLDIYIPSIQTGIEYQGKQHYEPIDFFGGEEKLKKQRRLDQKKRKLCIENNVRLIEWPYTKPITEENLMSFLKGI